MTSLPIRAGSRHGWSSVSKIAKRLMDLVGAVAGLILLSPLMLLIALALRLQSRGPILIREPRIGQGGIEFLARRFRVAPSRTFEGPSGEAIIEPWRGRAGEFLDRSGLGSLPILINVFRGEMSLVGPRALTLAEADVLIRDDSTVYSQRNSVPPGLIGPWQLEGRIVDDLSLMVIADIDYIKRWSLFLDLTLLMQAFGAYLWK